jgi:hypothetical protein
VEGGAYPVPLGSFLEKVQRGDFGPFDENGLPLVDYDRYFARNHVKHSRGTIGVHATPVTIALFGLAHHAQHLKEATATAKKNFLNAADWFVHNQVDERNTGGVWLHHFPMPHLPPLLEYKPRVWISGMAQGLGISLLLRAYAATLNWKYKECAARALLPFYFDVADGGVARAFSDESIFFEEFPADPPMRVLNGAQFALLGLLEYRAIENDHALHEFCEAAVEGMRRALPQFDLGYASLYDLRRRQVANAEYHTLHIQLLEALAPLCFQKPELRGGADVGRLDEFHRWADKWRGYMNNPLKKLRWWSANYWWAARRRMQGY